MIGATCGASPFETRRFAALLRVRRNSEGGREMPFASVNGVRLSYESVGEGTPLLFIHGGYGGHATTLAPQNHAIKTILPRDRVRTILYDRRNAGLSDYT